MSDESNDNIRTALDAGALLSEARYVDGIPYITLPAGGTHPAKVVDLAHLLKTPLRTKRTVVAHSLVGFLGYWNRHVANPVPEDSVASIYVNTEQHTIQAIFDDDARGRPGWRQHRAVYASPKSPEYAAWFGNDKRQMAQQDFAAFIEQNMPDVFEPPAADMLSVSRELEASKTVSFGQATRLDNGQVSLKYQEEIDGAVRGGAMKIPETFTLAIPIFLGGPTYKVTCRLRYRIPSGAGKGLTMFYEIDRPHVIVDDAFQQVVEAVTAGTGASVIEATPEKQ